MSEDGLGWKLEARPFVTGCSIDWADGRTEQVKHLERPQLHFEYGRSVALMAAAGCRDSDGVYAGGGFIILFK